MAKADKTGHGELSIEQANAIDLLVGGESDRKVAQIVGVTRQTICGWRLYHPDFRAELNKRRREVWGASADKLRSLLPRALEVIEQELAEGEHSVKVALALVKLAEIPLHSIGPHDPDAIVAEEARTRDMAALLSWGGTTDLTRVREELLEKAGG